MKFGLDFGTTNSSISMAENGRSIVVSVDTFASDPRVVRSMLYFFRRDLVYKQNIPLARIRNQNFMLGDIEYRGEFKNLIGQQAVNQFINDNANRKPGVKRTIFTGRWIKMRASGEASTVAEPEHYEEIDTGTGRLLQALKSSLKTLFKGTNLFGKYFTVEELIGLYIKNFKQAAEQASGQEIEFITIGRPVHFSDNPSVDQRAQDRLAVAMKSAGFKKLAFEYEPVAAAKQFFSDKSGDQKILVFDFGGGTLDTAIVEKKGAKISVLATDGVYIGGDLLNADIMRAKLFNYFGANTTFGDFNLPMPAHFYEALTSWYSIPTLNNPDTLEALDRLSYRSSNPYALERFIHLIKSNVGFELYEAIEKAKKQLSIDLQTKISFHDGPIDLEMLITRDEFQEIIKPRVDEVRTVVLQTLKSANLEPKDIDTVVRTGGSSLIPIFEKMLDNIFGKEKITLFGTFTSIAAGLSLD